MFQYLDNVISQNPKALGLLVIIILSTIFLPVALLIAIPIVLVIKRWHFPIFMVIILSFVLAMVVLLFGHIMPITLFTMNHKIFQHCLHGQWQALIDPYSLLCSLPAACVLATFMAPLIQIKNPLQRTLKRLSQGQSSQRPQQLSSSQLEKAFKAITSSALPHASIIGVDMYTGKPIVLTDQDANLHTLAIGTTGSGKSTGLCNIIESAILRKLPLIIVDGKGDRELAFRIGQFAQKNQRPFYCFSMVGESVKYNPLAAGGITSKKDRIIELRRWSEDHYRKIAEGYLQTVFSILTSLNITIDLFTLSQYLHPNALYNLARQHKSTQCLDAIDVLESKYKDISSLIAEIENMAKSEIGHLFDCRDGDVLTLQKAFEERATIYFCLQPLAFPAYAEALGRLIINDIKALAASQLQSTSKTKIYTIFDEFSVFAGEQIIHLINQGRSAGIHAILSTQSLADIERKGGSALVGQILNNCNNYLIQRQNHHGDAENLANIIGTMEALQVTSQISNTESQPVGTVRSSKEFIVHPDQIKRLGQGHAFYIHKQSFEVMEIGLRCSDI